MVGDKIVAMIADEPSGGCPVCKHEGGELKYEGINADSPEKPKVAIRKCLNCHAVFSAANGEVEKDLYPPNYFGENSAENFINRAASAVFRMERLHKVKTNSRAGGAALDIGCGDGKFLASLPDGWQRYGYEPSELGKSLLAGKEEIKLIDLFEPLAKNNFDIITFWQSLEHIDNPVETLTRAKELLSEDGYIFISVPNFSSLQASIFKGHWFHLDPMRHRVHYRLDTLKDIAEASGLELIERDTFSFEYGPFGIMQSILNAAGFEFNIFYKFLKARGGSPKGHRQFKRLAPFVLPPLLLITILLFLFESAVQRGGVINARFKKRSSIKDARIAGRTGVGCEVGRSAE